MELLYLLGVCMVLMRLRKELKHKLILLFPQTETFHTVFSLFSEFYARKAI